MYSCIWPCVSHFLRYIARRQHKFYLIHGNFLQNASNSDWFGLLSSQRLSLQFGFEDSAEKLAFGGLCFKSVGESHVTVTMYFLLQAEVRTKKWARI